MKGVGQTLLRQNPQQWVPSASDTGQTNTGKTSKKGLEEQARGKA